MKYFKDVEIYSIIKLNNDDTLYWKVDKNTINQLYTINTFYCGDMVQVEVIS